MLTVVDKALINYEIFGKNNKKTILILHGWGRSLDEWIPLSRTIEKFYKIILLDLPGFGKSSFFNKKQNNLLDYKNILHEFLIKNSLNPDIIIGHSFGGKLATLYCTSEITCSKLILVSPSLLQNRNIFISAKIIIIKFFKLLSPLTPKFITQRIWNLFGSEDYKNAGENRETFKNIINVDLTHLLTKIKIPTYLLWGDLDQVLPVSYALKLKSMIKNSRVRIIWNAKHFPHLEKSHQFSSVLNECL